MCAFLVSLRPGRSCKKILLGFSLFRTSFYFDVQPATLLLMRHPDVLLFGTFNLAMCKLLHMLQSRLKLHVLHRCHPAPVFGCVSPSAMLRRCCHCSLERTRIPMHGMCATACSAASVYDSKSLPLLLQLLHDACDLHLTQIRRPSSLNGLNVTLKGIQKLVTHGPRWMAFEQTVAPLVLVHPFADMWIYSRMRQDVAQLRCCDRAMWRTCTHEHKTSAAFA